MSCTSEEQPAQQPTPLFLRADLAAWEQHVARLQQVPTLMHQAGQAAADVALAIALPRPGTIEVWVGPGNNGGDGLTVARLLHTRGISVCVVTLDQRPWQGDAALAWQAACAAEVPTTGFRAALPEAPLVVDALFGSGLNRAPSGAASQAIDAINQARARGTPVLALDLPSGLVCDTGKAFAPCVRASRTLTFLGPKPGLYTADGPDHCGIIQVCPLVPRMDRAPAGWLTHPRAFADLLRARPKASHKGSFGTLAVIGGAPGTFGAALLAARAALYLGAGKVLVETLGDGSMGVDLLHPELMLRPHIDFDQVQAAVIGPGLGTSDAARDRLAEALNAPRSLVLDADALNLLSQHSALEALMARRNAPQIVTPHPLEAARLLGVAVATVQNDRLAAALAIAKRLQAVTVLKGVGSIIAAPDGRWSINPSGNPGLASGGTGDVLAGVAGALLCRSGDAFMSALAAGYLHGDGADRLVATGVGPAGMTASELIPAIRASLNWHSQVWGSL